MSITDKLPNKFTIWRKKSSTKWAVAFLISIIVLVYVTFFLMGIHIDRFSTGSIKMMHVAIYAIAFAFVFLVAIAIITLNSIKKLNDDRKTWYMREGLEPCKITELLLDPDTGKLEHGGDRHVLFHIKTLRKLMFTAFVEEKQSEGDVGKEIGQNFGVRFIKHLRTINILPEEGEVRNNDKTKVPSKRKSFFTKYEYEYTFTEVVSLWCEFDVSGGWGKWKHAPDSTTENKGTITIMYNFLVNHDTELQEARNFCNFLEGYIDGVLETLYGTINGNSINYEVKQENCCSDGRRTETCVFLYEPKS